MRALPLLLLFALACDDTTPEATPSDASPQADSAAPDAALDAAPPPVERLILPGEGLTLSDTTLRLGEAWPQTLGDPTEVRDLGPLGRRFEIPGRGISGLMGPGEGPIIRLTISEGARAEAPAGWGLGSSRAELLEALGPGREDPFLGMSWYPSEGLAFTWSEDKVSRIELFQP